MKLKYIGITLAVVLFGTLLSILRVSAQMAVIDPSPDPVANASKSSPSVVLDSFSMREVTTYSGCDKAINSNTQKSIAKTKLNNFL